MLVPGKSSLQNYCQHLIDRLLQLLIMDLSGKMDRTLAMDGIPAGGIGITIELGLETNLSCRILCGVTDQPLCRLPSCTAGRSTNYCNVCNFAVFNNNLKFRRTEIFAIPAKANLPWKTTSRRRGEDTFSMHFLTRCNHRDIVFTAEGGEVCGEVIMTKKIKHQVAG